MSKLVWLAVVLLIAAAIFPQWFGFNVTGGGMNAMGWFGVVLAIVAACLFAAVIAIEPEDIDEKARQRRE